MRNTLIPALALTALLSATLIQASAQEGIPTQTLIRVDSKSKDVPTLDTTKLEINNKPAQLSAITPIQPTGVQIALLIDDGLRRSAAIQLDDIKKFIQTLPTGTEILVGYMSNGGVRLGTPFTTNHADAVAAIRIPMGLPGISASPYFCLSEFVKHWPGNDATEFSGSSRPSGTSARFAIMITNGVDPYNGSTSIMNQDSPYVATAIKDAQRAGVAVSSIYYGDAGIRGGSANFSGQSYLQQVADGTGGEAYYQGTGNPVSLLPFFKKFQAAISETYIATFPAIRDSKDQLVRIQVKSSIPKLKLRHAEEVRPGNHESPQA